MRHSEDRKNRRHVYEVHLFRVGGMMGIWQSELEYSEQTGETRGPPVQP